MANHSSLLAWRISRTEEPDGLTVHGVTKSQTSETAWHSIAPLSNWKKKEAAEWGFPGGSHGKESACNVGDLGLIPRLGSCLVAKLCLTLCDSMGLPGPSVHGISQARILEWIAISYPRGSS